MERVGDLEPDVRVRLEHLAERRDDGPVELDREDLRPRRGERNGERSEARADLEDAIAPADLGEGGDPAGEVRVDEEVLTERGRGADVVALGELPDRAPPEGPTR